MARSSATAALLLLALSLLAVAHCRTVAVAADHAAELESTAAVVVSDENRLSSHPTLPAAEAGASATEEEEVLPAGRQQQQQHDFEFLRLPSHRFHRHRPCSLHRHLWWKRHHGVGVYRDAPLRFPTAEEARTLEEVKPVAEPDPDRSLPDSDVEGELVARREHHGVGVYRDAPLRFPTAEEARTLEEVMKPVAEPDPDRSLPDSDGERDLVARREPSFADANGHDDEHAAAAVRTWKEEMLRRWFDVHHGMRRPRLHHVHHDEEEGEAAPEGMNMKRFHFHHDDDEEDKERNMMGKRLPHAEHGEDSDDDEDEEVEEMVRQFRKAIMKRKFGHGHGHGHGRRFFHHDHRHRHAEEAEKHAGRGDEQSGVMAWIKGLMN